MRTATEIETRFAARDQLAGAKRYFFVGIGGAGMSGIARMLRNRGYTVLGTDSTDSVDVSRLREDGIDVRVGHSGVDLQPGDALILTDAIDLKVSPEVLRAEELGLPLFRRSQALGWLLQDKKVIAVTGTHGKSTTTGMLGAALKAAGLEPTIVVGAFVPELGSSILEGKGDWAVIEACEAYDSLRDLDATLVVLTNLEPDHLDFHGDWNSLKARVEHFVNRAEKLTYQAEDSGAVELSDSCRIEKIGCDRTTFSALGGDTGRLRMPGEHNILNAGLALQAAVLAGAQPGIAAGAIEDFSGVERRLQLVFDEGISVIDDYAHHPVEIKASLQALRSRFPGRRLVVVYQPHLYTRTRDFLPDFSEALNQADFIVMTDIYPAREAPIPGISSARIVEQITKPVRYVPSRHVLPRAVKRWVKEGDVVVGMGAGNISDFAPAFVQELKRPERPHHVVVIYGGDSAEREISLLSGNSVAKALQERGYVVSLLDVTEVLLTGGNLSALSGPNRPDVAVLAVHGTHAEDGAIQGMLELLHLPYSGSGVQSSSLAMDKDLTKRILRGNDIPVAEGILIWKPNENTLNAPVVVKPNAQGSTVGLSFVETDAELSLAIERALSYGSGALIEEWIRGVEISVPVLEDRALPAVEIVPRSGRYDFAAKYESGGTEEICPARITSDQESQARDLALRSHQALKCRGASRTDIMIDPQGKLYVLEVNTLPGMTSTSLLPKSASTAGMSYGDLCEWIVLNAWSQHAEKI